MRYLVLVLAAFGATLAHAQPTFSPGDRVRVTTADGSVTGVVVADQADTLIVRHGSLGATTPFPYADIRALDLGVSRSRWRGAAKGALILGGAATVVTLGLAGASATVPESMGAGFILIYGAVAVPAAAAVGAAFGALLPGERWEPARYAPASLGVGGAGLSLRVRL